MLRFSDPPRVPPRPVPRPPLEVEQCWCAAIDAHLDRTPPHQWFGDLDQLGHPWARVFALRAMAERSAGAGPFAIHLVEALAAAGAVEDALALAAEGHQAEPDLYDLKELVLDILFSTGRNERDFPWLEPPRVLRLDPALKDALVRWLRRRVGGVEITDLLLDCLLGSYLCFSEDELVVYLAADPRFVVERDESGTYLDLVGGA